MNLFFNKGNQLIIYLSNKNIQIAILKNDKYLYHYSKNLNKDIDLTQQLQDALNRIPKSHSNLQASVILGADIVIQRIVKIPFSRNYSDALYWELAKLYANKLDNFWWNCKLLNAIIEDAQKKQIFKIEIVTRKIIDIINSVLKQYNYKIDMIISEETIIEELLDKYHHSLFANKNVLLFDMEFESVVISYLENGVIKYKRVLENSAEQLKDIIKNYYKIDDTNELLKTISNIHILPYSTPSETTDKYINFSNALKNSLTNIINETKKTTAYILSNFRVNQIEFFYMFGEFSEINGLQKMFSTEFNKEFTKLNFPNISADIPLTKKHLISVIQNLSKKNIIDLTKFQKSSITLSSDEVFLFGSLKNKIAGGLLIITMLILPSLISNIYSQSTKKYNELLNEIKNKNQELSNYLAAQTIVTINKQFKTAIEKKDYNYQKILTMIGNSTPNGITLTRININTKDFNSPTEIIIEGWSADVQIIPEFILKLDSSGLFHSINLENSSRGTFRNLELMRFQINATLKEAQLL